MLNRRELIGGTTALLAASALPAQATAGAFVQRSGSGFVKGGLPFRVAGTNMWAAAYLGAAEPVGDRNRLKRELDRIAALGLTNIRILGSSEFSPLKNSVRPTFRNQSAHYNEALLRGLDHALAEMAKRGLTAVIYLTNFWEWSGAMMTYLSWSNGGRYINMNDPAHPWPEFADMSSEFYAHAASVRMFDDYVRALVRRRNSVTDMFYRDDPTIMAWQLANEPRPGGSRKAAQKHMHAFLLWIGGTARLIKSIDANHMVSTGSEGTQGCVDDEECVVEAHSSPMVDYVTGHIWPQNWGWADPKDLAGTWFQTERNAQAYLARQIAAAKSLNKPLVIEEFGYPRDGGSFDPGATTRYRDHFYNLLYDATLASIRSGGPLQGANFWGWGGEGRTRHSDHRFVRGDTSYLADPPHEPQGWYSVFDSDASTQAVIRNYAAALSKVNAGAA